MPPEPPKRHPSRPEVFLDLQPERAAVRHSGVDGVPQALPNRSATLIGLPALAAPDSRPPLPPAVPLEYAATKRPPLPWGKTVRAPSPPPLVAASRRTDPPAPIESTPSESPPGSLSGDQTTLLRDELTKTRAELAQARRDVRAAAEAKLNTYPPQIAESVRAPAPDPAPKHTDDEPTPRAWKAALFKVVVGLGALLTAAATILGVRANTAIEPKVETNAVRTRVVETAADTLTDRVAKLEAFARAETKRRQCVEAQLRDALARGTGHVLTTLPAEPTGWSEQNSPKNEPRLYWKSPTWFTVQGCDAAPAPP